MERIKTETHFITGSSLNVDSGVTADFAAGSNVDFTGANVTGLTNTGNITGPNSSDDNSMVVFDGLTGHKIKESTATGIPLLTAGVMGTPITTSAGMAAAISDEHGTGNLLFAAGTINITSGKTIAGPKTGEILTGDDTNLSGGTVLTVGTHYYDTLSADRVVTFAGSPTAGGNATILRLICTSGPHTLSFPSSFRVGESATPITSLSVPTGYNEFSWLTSGGAVWLIDTLSDTTGLVPITRVINGHPLSADFNISDADVVFTDVVTNNASNSAHGYLKKLPNDPTVYLDGTGSFTGPAASNQQGYVDKFDEFLGGTIAEGSIGDLGWRTSTAGIYTYQAGVANHPGLLQIETGGSINTFAGIYLSGSTTLLPFLGLDAFDFRFVLHFNTLTTTTMRFGIGNATTAAPTEGAYFEFIGGTDTTIFCLCRTIANATARSDTTYVPSVSAGVFPSFRVRRITNHSIGFTVNTLAEVVITTTPGNNDPEIPMTGFVQLTNTAASDKSLLVDFFELRDNVGR